MPWRPAGDVRMPPASAAAPESARNRATPLRLLCLHRPCSRASANEESAMTRLGAATVIGSLAFSVASALALDVPLDANTLLLRRTPAGREILELVARDDALGVPERRGADDPSMPGADGAMLELFGGDGSYAALPIPGGGGMPGWRAQEGRRKPRAFRYLNPAAPDGPSTVKLLVLREGKGLGIVGRAVGLPLEGQLGRVGIRLTIGTLRLCALFDESTVAHDQVNRFAARKALAAALPDCSDESLRLFPLPASSTTTSTSSTTTTSTSSTTTTTLADLTFGNATEFSGASSHSPGFLLGSPVQIPVAVTITHLAVIAKAGGANVLLGLYRQSGGVPTTLVVGTSPTPLAPGRLEIPVTPTTIAAGTYWLMAMYDTDASVGLDTSVANAQDAYAFRDFSQGLPATVSQPTSMFGQRYNYYLRGIP
jgi:hypothetical protein